MSLLAILMGCATALMCAGYWSKTGVLLFAAAGLWGAASGSVLALSSTDWDVEYITFFIDIFMALVCILGGSNIRKQERIERAKTQKTYIFNDYHAAKEEIRGMRQFSNGQLKGMKSANRRKKQG